MMRSNKLIGGVLVGLMMIGAVALAAGDDAKKPPATQPSTPPAPPAPPSNDKPPTPPAPPSNDKPPTPPAGSGSAAAEVHAGTGYENHAVSGEAQSFPANTKVFVVSLVTGANGTQVKHVWKKDGAELWTATLNVASNHWTTSSRRVLAKAGQYEVDVVGADGAELGKVEFAIQ